MADSFSLSFFAGSSNIRKHLSKNVSKIYGYIGTAIFKPLQAQISLLIVERKIDKN